MFKLLVEHAVELSFAVLILLLSLGLFLGSLICLVSFLTFGGS